MERLFKLYMLWFLMFSGGIEGWWVSERLLVFLGLQPQEHSAEVSRP